MLVTILTVAFRSENTIARTIESVLAQTYPQIEYIIVEGASGDNTVQIAESYRKQFEEKNYIYRIVSEKDKGMYDALNKGAKLAHGEIVGQINSDDWYEPEAVDTMVKHYQQTRFDIAWADVRILKASGNFVKKAFIGKHLWTTAGFNHPTMFTRREVLLEYPYACRHMDDDFDMVTRAKLAGKKIIVTHGVLADFTFGGMSTEKSLKNLRIRIKMKYDTYRRHGFSRLYWFYCFAMETAKFILG